ncbi:MAG: penicillin acylase family protein, partial [Myxococcales bacterium]|nr:penicillin acylase family protein [Myxococcales bacterium]
PACGDDGGGKDAATDTIVDTATPDDADATATADADATDADDADASGPTAAQAAVLGVTETGAFTLPGLKDTVQVLRTAGDIPRVYAANREDLGRVMGFIEARHRYFFMDLQRRYGLGTISALVGDVALANDVQARSIGMAYVTDRLVEHASPEFLAYLEAFAGGINAYIDGVRAGELEPPTETSFAALLGFDSAADMMAPFTARDVMALITVIMYQTNFETGDLGNTSALERLDAQFAGFPDEALRKSGYLADLWNDVRPFYPGAHTTDGFGLTGSGQKAAAGHAAKARRGASALPTLPAGMAEDLANRLAEMQRRFGKDRGEGFGSNVWAVAGTHTKDGAALLANDGHLGLTVPSLGYGAGLDTAVFGGGDIHQVGGWLGCFPVMIGGTNGQVAFGGVNPVLDITDWYQEEIELDAAGIPKASRFEGAWKDLVATEETYDVRGVALLGSVARTETWARFKTFDGRWLASIEGRPATADTVPGAGESVINLGGTLIVPADVNNDGVVSGITFDHTALDATRWGEALAEMGMAHDVNGVREATRGFVGAALFTGGADDQGNILYTSYQAVPCRGYLERDGDGKFVAGADPTRLLDGTKYGGFTMPTDENGKADEGPGATDPYKCIIPFDEMPYAINPEQGFVFNANNDPAHITDDGDHENDQWYVGGPWSSVRADTIRRELAKVTADHEADIAAMQAIQANKTSRTGEDFVPSLLDAIARGKAITDGDGPVTPAEARVGAVYEAHRAAFDAVATRLSAWSSRGFVAYSGVETFYDHPDAGQVQDSIATMIFNAYLPRFLQSVWDDEQISAWRWDSTREKLGALRRFLAGRGAGNPASLASWNAATEESVFFDDVRTTDAVETSDELMLASLAGALDFLASAPTGPGEGGFGTTDMEAWLWGLRHQARFQSVIADFIGGDSEALSIITDMFQFTTDIHPLADSYEQGDPRAALKWFPRGGDNYGVDAANPGFSGTRFTHGSGPAMRIVFALKDGEMRGEFALPGGASGIVDSPFFADQLRLWLANATNPLVLDPVGVAAIATGREVYTPAE